MLNTIEAGKIFVREGTALPKTLQIESEPYMPGWRAVKNLDGYALDRKIHDAGWTFFCLAYETKATVFGIDAEKMMRRAIERILANREAEAEKFNSLEIGRVGWWASKRFLGIRQVTVSAQSRHIQESPVIFQVEDKDFEVPAQSGIGLILDQRAGLSPSKKVSLDDVKKPNLLKELLMKTMMRNLVVSFFVIVVILLSVHQVPAQDLSKYRNFSFGMTVADVSKQIDQKPANAAVLHEHPGLIQELTWWPPRPYSSLRPAEPVDQILFSFYNGALYRMLVTYENSATKGLNDEDMIRAVSAKYGVATRPLATVVSFPTNSSYHTTEKVIARWEDSQYSLSLFRSSGDTFAVVMFTKELDAQAGISIAESVKLEQEEAPQKEAARAKKDAEDLELERQKNIKTLRP